MSVFSYESFFNGEKPKKLVVFLHGYNSCIDDLLPSIEILKQHLTDTLFIVPSSEMICERNPNKKQWFALMDIDPDKKRRNPSTSVKNIIDIYNKAGERISCISKKINQFITDLQSQYKIADENTYIMGFSQGAMLAIYTSLTRKAKVAGAFSFAGIICGKDLLEKEINSYPDIYLFHGTNDLSVQYKTLGFTKKWLDKYNVMWEAIEYDGIEHKLIEDEMFDAIDIINRKEN